MLSPSCARDMYGAAEASESTMRVESSGLDVPSSTRSLGRSSNNGKRR